MFSIDHTTRMHWVLSVDKMYYSSSIPNVYVYSGVMNAARATTTFSIVSAKMYLARQMDWCLNVHKDPYDHSEQFRDDLSLILDLESNYCKVRIVLPRITVKLS